jgi:hypothetical protein
MGAGQGRSSDLQANLLFYSPIFPSRSGTVMFGFSFLLTAAGQSWILTRFPFQHAPKGSTYHQRFKGN